MQIQIKPIDPVNRPFFAGEVSGADWRKVPSPEEAEAIHRGMDEFGVLVFRDQDIDDEQQVAFSRALGPLESATGDIARPEERRLSMDVNDISNVDKDNKVVARDDRRRLFGLGNQLWHSDSSFRAIPAKYSLLSGRIVVDQGGNTEFADMRAAYDALDDRTKAEIEDLICEHSLIYSRGTLGFTELSEEEKRTFTPVRQRLVRTHPVTGRKSLYLSSHIGTIVGWPMPEARAFIRDLAEHATQKQFTYSHKWRQYDLVVWDNRVTMHRVRRFDETQVRDMRRTTVAGDSVTVEQLAA